MIFQWDEWASLKHDILSIKKYKTADLMFSTKSVLNREGECYVFFDLISMVILVSELSVLKKSDITEIHFISDEGDP